VGTPMTDRTSIPETFSSSIELLKDMAFPSYCKWCDERIFTHANFFYCPRCWDQIEKIERPFCSVCGRPHEKAVGFAREDNFPCADCREIKRRDCDRIYAAGVYGDVLEDAVKRLKFGRKRLLAGPMGRLAAEFARQEIDIASYDMIVPVPLHPVRRRERGFNQAVLLAESLIHELAPLVHPARLCMALERARYTAPQTTLDAEQRKKNIKGAFAAQAGAEVEGNTVLVVDDVVTTGSTVGECARILKQAGAERVDALAVARRV